ncbi:MAG: type II secretion system F family protein [Candidatus Aenigmarchaeota archaeon]|nr:type II secretion system F family protein [Candidatus Aenigmarchaeota archaeon]
MELNERNILIGSFVVSMLLIGIAVTFSGSFALSTNLIFIAIIILTAPYSIYKFFEFKRVRAFESEFPNFLRDLAESQRAGLSILQSIQLAARSDYGSLTHEVKKMDNQLSWNVPLEKVLNNFIVRMKNSRIISRSVMVILESNKSGGNIEDTMESLAGNIEMLRDVQEEKNTLMNQQVLMMYAIFFIFLGITIALIKFLIPLVQTQSESGIGLVKGTNSNPCFECISSASGACVGCNTFFSVSALMDFGEKTDPSAYYKSLFFIMIIVQGFFTGLIAGQIGSDSIAAGVKHSAILLITGVSIFLITVRTGIV